LLGFSVAVKRPSLHICRNVSLLTEPLPNPSAYALLSTFAPKEPLASRLAAFQRMRHSLVVSAIAAVDSGASAII